MTTGSSEFQPAAAGVDAPADGGGTPSPLATSTTTANASDAVAATENAGGKPYPQERRSKSRRESHRHPRKSGTDGGDEQNHHHQHHHHSGGDGKEDHIENSGELTLPTRGGEETRKSSSSARPNYSKSGSSRRSSRRHQHTKEEGNPNTDVFLPLKDATDGEDAETKPRSRSRTRHKSRSDDNNNSGELKLPSNDGNTSGGDERTRRRSRSGSSRHRRTVGEEDEATPATTMVPLKDKSGGGGDNEDSRRRNRSHTRHRSRSRPPVDNDDGHEADRSGELGDRHSGRRRSRRDSRRRSSPHGTRKRSSSKRRKDSNNKRKSKSRKSKRQRAKDFISSSASLFSRSARSATSREKRRTAPMTAPAPLFGGVPDEYYTDDDTIASNQKQDDKQRTRDAMAPAPKPSCWVQAWQKRWFRVVLALVGIGLAILITYLVMKFTGLGMEDESTDNETQGNNGGKDIQSIPISPSPTPALTEAASLVPTAEVTPLYKYPPPNDAICRAFITGRPSGLIPGDVGFLGPGSITLDFDFNFDVVLSRMTSAQEEKWLEDFQDQIMVSLLPLLVGCLEDSTSNRRLKLDALPSLLRRSEGKSDMTLVQSTTTGHSRELQDSNQSEIRYVIQNAKVIDTVASKSPCPNNPRQNPADDPSCYLVTVIMELSLRGEERIFPVLSLLANILGEFAEVDEDGASGGGGNTLSSTLVEKVGLSTSLFQSLSVVGVQNRDPTNSPSISPSLAPSASPSSMPTPKPSQSPTISPSESPSTTPSTSPTDRPTGRPTPVPTRTPTKSPTDPPSRLPSSSPSRLPSNAPSRLPSVLPSMVPSGAPTKSVPPTKSMVPSSGPTDSLAPSSGPSATPV
ncbi:unnamed protein product [Cylindrotheca closterium]|uniref:Uncharacterized protein n=1 Tax=Cylindrotheca closterium TaxID=2856 RepID=A0AAD2JLD1_9STRA|nr:unnamed protein product [Cylindrotheca closterium]